MSIYDGTSPPENSIVKYSTNDITRLLLKLLLDSGYAIIDIRTTPSTIAITENNAVILYASKIPLAFLNTYLYADKSKVLGISR